MMSHYPKKNYHSIYCYLQKQESSQLNQGKAGRVFKEKSGKFLGRVTGLDPAGVKFQDPKVLKEVTKADPELKAVNILNILHNNFLQTCPLDVHTCEYMCTVLQNNCIL